MKKTKKELEEELKVLNAAQTEVQKQLDIIYNDELKKEKKDNLKFLNRLKSFNFIELISHSDESCTDINPWDVDGCQKCKLLQIFADMDNDIEYKVKINVEIEKFPEFKSTEIK